MSYINPLWVIDQVASDIMADDDVTQYDAAVDRMIEIQCAIESVRIDEIPLDISDFTTSCVLQAYGILLFKKYLFEGYAGSSDGDPDDVYMGKLPFIEKSIREIEPMITRQSILGLFDEGGEPKSKLAVIKQIPNIQGAFGGRF